MVIYKKILKLSHLRVTETSLVIWLNIVTIVAQSVCVWPTSGMDVERRGCEDTYAKTSMPFVNGIVTDGLVSAMPNMQQTLVQFTPLVYIKLLAVYKEYLTGIRN